MDELFEDDHYRPDVRPERVSGRKTCDTRGCMKDPTHRVVWAGGWKLPYCEYHARVVLAFTESEAHIEQET